MSIVSARCEMNPEKAATEASDAMLVRGSVSPGRVVAPGANANANTVRERRGGK